MTCSAISLSICIWRHFGDISECFLWPWLDLVTDGPYARIYDSIHHSNKYVSVNYQVWYIYWVITNWFTSNHGNAASKYWPWPTLRGSSRFQSTPFYSDDYAVTLLRTKFGIFIQSVTIILHVIMLTSVQRFKLTGVTWKPPYFRRFHDLDLDYEGHPDSRFFDKSF